MDTNAKKEENKNEMKNINFKKKKRKKWFIAVAQTINECIFRINAQ